jgi:BlaI family transcriptional regulator, penicillinase repressor
MAGPVPTARELQILNVLWAIGPATVRQVHERLCPRGELAFNTIQTLLRIMDDKGLVVHKVRGRRFLYRAKHGRDREMNRLLETVFQGAVDQFVVSFLKTADPGPEELLRIEQIIADARRQKLKGRQHVRPEPDL